MAEMSAIDAPPIIARPQPNGIGGWLALMAIGQVFGPLRVLVSLGQLYSSPNVSIAFQRLPLAVYGELVLNLTYLGIVFFATFAFFTKRAIFKAAFTVEVFAIALIVPLDHLWLSLSTNVNIPSDAEDMGRNFATALFGLIWVAYVWKSDRVRNTFVN